MDKDKVLSFNSMGESSQKSPFIRKGFNHMGINIRKIVCSDGINAHPEQHFIDDAVTPLPEIMLHMGISVFSTAENNRPLITVAEYRVDIAAF